jgi:outer membrane receptor for ferrienterochelin and colicin
MNGMKPLSRCLALAFGGSALMLALSTSAYAQSNATANVFGQIESGEGAVVTVENVSTGLKRTITADSSGRYQLSSLPGGTYKVTVSKDGKVTNTRESVEVLVGQGNEISFIARANETIVVTGARQAIDVSNTNSSVTFTASELSKLPIANNVGAIIQLAPGTTRGDSRYGGANAPSFGGASASENAYYINGFPVTNGLYQVGASQLPFNSIAQAQILNGGYSAEFGRSTGGVVNITTKSGTNNWEAGIAASITPNSLRSRPKNIYYDNTGANPGSDGKIFLYQEKDKDDTYSVNAYFGGPIVKDKLFIFFNGEINESSRSEIRRDASNNTASKLSGWQERTTSTPRYLGKVDWNLTENHRLEFTAIHDEFKDKRSFYGFDYTTLERNSIKAGGREYVNSGPTPIAAPQGADVYIGKYTGYITDNFTVNALVGTSQTKRSDTPEGYLPSVFQTVSNATSQAPGVVYTNPQNTTGNLLTPGAKDEQTTLRLDGEYKLSSHTIRAGLDNNTIKSVAGSSRAGGGTWSYQRTAAANTVPTSSVPFGGQTPESGGGLGVDRYYVQKILVSNVSSPQVVQSAQYLEDRYQVSKEVLLSLGLRNETFDNKNGDGVSYIKESNQLAPRLGATWDLYGNSSLKVFANAGRYFLQIPTNVAVRAAGSSLFTQQNFTYTGVDPATGAPIGLNPISPVFSGNNEFGQPVDPNIVAAKNIKPHFQDELSVGFQQAISSKLNYGVKFTYRDLKSTIDDFCDQRPFDAWAQRNGVTNNFAFRCALFNPGEANTFQQDINGDGILETINLSAAELGYPKVKRTYKAFDLFVEHPFDGKFYGKVDYTYSRSEGNTEGQLLSDIGQADVATTQVFDYPEIMQNSSGLLPNNRTHQVKAYGYYQALAEWGVGANLLAASGRPKNCIGEYPDPNNAAAAYGSAFFYCNGIASPRGSRGTLPWDYRLDMNVVYKPNFVKGLQFKVDVFNLFNRQAIQVVSEVYTDGSGAVDPQYGRVVSYTAPRSLKLSVQYDYKF